MLMHVDRVIQKAAPGEASASWTLLEEILAAEEKRRGA